MYSFDLHESMTSAKKKSLLLGIELVHRLCGPNPWHVEGFALPNHNYQNGKQLESWP
jgi:hypothetical protein